VQEENQPSGPFIQQVLRLLKSLMLLHFRITVAEHPVGEEYN